MDLQAMAMAAAAWLGAAMAWSATWSRWLLLVVAVVLLIVHRRCRRLLVPMLVLACLLVGSHLGLRADRAYRPVSPGPFTGPVTALADPEPVGAGWSLEVRLPDGRRVLSSSFGRAGSTVSQVAIGQPLVVDGRLASAEGQPWLRTRHISGRLSIDNVELVGRPSLLRRLPELIRERIAAGAEAMDERQRALYLGLVIGDDRTQPLGQRLRFNAAGLTHLLAVSGQNVAFALAVARPLLNLMGYRGRFLGLAAVLVTFAIITRLEPSVLRATVTAAITAWATLTGRERSGLTVLALAVVGLIAVDPFLVDSVGFQLSVAASGAIILIGPSLERRLPGPDWLSGPLAVTLSAQLGVSPLLIGYFGPVSLASVPANLLAGWAAAAVMTLGLTVGVVAGLLPDPLGGWLQQPTEWLLWWVEAVAAWHTALPAPRLALGGLLVLLLATMLYRLSPPPLLRVLAAVIVVIVLARSVPSPPRRPTECGAGMNWYPGGADHTSVLTLSGEASDRSLRDCLGRGVSSVQVVVLSRGSARAARLATAMVEVMHVDLIAAPPQHRVVGARRQLRPGRIRTADGVVTLSPSADGRELRITFAATTGPHEQPDQ